MPSVSSCGMRNLIQKVDKRTTCSSTYVLKVTEFNIMARSVLEPPSLNAQKGFSFFITLHRITITLLSIKGNIHNIKKCLE